MIEICQYDPSNEEKWLKCHYISYYNSIYFDELVKVKPRYEYPSIELVGILNDEIVGILDIEIEEEPGQFCTAENERSAMISVIGVTTEYRRKGIATQLVERALDLILEEHDVHRLEIWVRDDTGIITWLKKNSFQEIHRFFEVILTSDFFDKFGIEIPFEIVPTSLTGIIESDGFSQLTQQHPPERTFPIVIYERLL